MNKIAYFRRKLYIEGAIAITVSIICAGAWLLLDNYNDDLLQEERKVQRDLIKAQRSMRVIEQDLDKSKKSYQFYQQIKGQQETDVSRKNIIALLNALKDEYSVSALSLEVSPIASLQGDVFDRKNIRTIATEVNINFKSFSDQEAISFVDALRKNISGYIRMTELSMKKIGDIDQSAVYKAEKGEPFNLVETSLSFYLYGLEDKGNNQISVQ